MPKRPLTPEDLWLLPRVGNPVPSPDGASVLVPVTTFDLGADEGVTRLWRVPTAARRAGRGGPRDPARALTSAEASSSQPAVSPDGARIAFVRKPGGPEDSKREDSPRHPDEPQLYVMPGDGGEPERMTDLPFGVADPRWFPDGRRIAFLAYVYAGVDAIEEVGELKKKRKEDPVRAYVTEDRVYRFWDRWLTDGKVHHLYVLDTETGEMMDLLPGSDRHFAFGAPSDAYRIAPDGREIAFGALRSEPPYDPLAWGVFTVRVPARIRPGRKPPRVTHVSKSAAGNAFGPVYTPDGSGLVYGRTEDLFFYADRVRLVCRDRESGEEVELTGAWDRSPSAWELSADGRRVLILADEGACSVLWSLDLAAAAKSRRSREPAELLRGGSTSGLSVAGGRVFFLRSSLRSPPQVFSAAEDGADLREHTDFGHEVLRDVELSRVKEVSFEGAEGRRVQMFLLAPPGERIPGRRSKKRPRWPLVHMIHGGPHGTFGDEWHWRWNAQAFAAPGHLVALVNFHGSTSFGQEFARSIRGRWGDQPYRDIEAATDHLIREGLADRKRLAVTGGSYGGYLVSWICSHTGRYACAVNHAGVSDFQTQNATDVTQGRRESMGGELWDDIEGLDRYNPIRHARGFETPMLVIHGQRDYRVPYNQGLEIYNVLKAMGVPARLVVYPDENHWILRPGNSRHWYGEVLGWLDRWL